MTVLDNLTITVFNYWIKDLGLMGLFMSGEKNTVYTTFCAKPTEKRVKNKQEKNRAPITKFFGVTWFEKRKPNKPRTKTKVKQYYNQPISLFSKSKPTPPHGSSSSFTSLTPSYCFCFLLHKNQKPKTKKKKQNQSDGLLWVLVSIRDSPRKRTEPPKPSAQYPDSITFYAIYWLCTNRRSSFFLWVLFLWRQSCHQ